MVELLFTMALLVTTIGATVSLYVFVVTRAGDAATQYNVYQQTNDLMKAFTDVTSNAISCQTVSLSSGGTAALKCTMPAGGTDLDNDGIIDIYQPSGVYKTLQEYYSPGNRIWYFSSTKPPIIGAYGNYWYRAVRTDDLNPTLDDIDTKWSYVTGTTPRIYIPGSISFSNDSTKLSTNIQIAVSSSSQVPVSGYQGDKAIELPAITLRRRLFWRGGK